MMVDSDELTFACPDCQETIDVNPPMRTALIEHGCVICGAGVDDSDFS